MRWIYIFRFHNSKNVSRKVGVLQDGWWTSKREDIFLNSNGFNNIYIHCQLWKLTSPILTTPVESKVISTLGDHNFREFCVFNMLNMLFYFYFFYIHVPKFHWILDFENYWKLVYLIPPPDYPLTTGNNPSNHLSPLPTLPSSLCNSPTITFPPESDL